MASPSYEWRSRSSPLPQNRSPVHARQSPAAAKSSPAPDTASPIVQGRLIRPLPKRRLRDRLSDEQTESIVFPTAPPRSSPLFSIPYAPHPEPSTPRTVRFRPEISDVTPDAESNVESRRRDEFRAGVKSPPIAAHSRLRPQARSLYPKPSTAHIAPDSANSSVDGDESFENTNTKKRKIPLSNGLGAHHSALSAEMANMGISGGEAEAAVGAEDPVRAVGTYYGTGLAVPPGSAAVYGMPGPGRSRHSRSGRGSLERRPLGTSTNGVNYSGSVAARSRPAAGSASAKAGSPGPPKQSVIIAQAIASAKNVDLPASNGDDDTSLLEAFSRKVSIQEDEYRKANFTFTCEPPSDKVWPGQTNMSTTGHNYPPDADASQRRPAPPPNATSGSSAQTPQMQQGQSQQAPPPKPRPRRPGRVYELAARRRRLQQEYINLHHPPRREDIWICEFCEYEAIYGEPPKALIRAYEKKDRRETKRLEERRRLLEKAKIKGRKGKKGTKASKALAQQAAELQKKEYLRATAEMDRAAATGAQAPLKTYRNNSTFLPEPEGEASGGAGSGDYPDDQDDLFDEDGILNEDEDDEGDGEYGDFYDDEGDDETEEMDPADAQFYDPGLEKESLPPPGDGKGKDSQVARFLAFNKKAPPLRN